MTTVSLEPKVSVIVPVYNGAAYLAEALSSILGQTHRSFEIIVVDDGSTDESGKIIGRYASPVRALFQENRGTGAARNRGVEAARASLVAFLDQDDLWEAGKLAAQVAALSADSALDAVFGMVRQFHSPDADEEFRRCVACPAEPIPGYLPSAMLIRKEAFQRVGGFGEEWQLAEWSDWFVRAIERGLTMHLLPDLVARRRLHAGNKGIVLRRFQHEYPCLLKAMLERRRATAAKTGIDSDS